MTLMVREPHLDSPKAAPTTSERLDSLLREWLPALQRTMRKDAHAQGLQNAYTDALGDLMEQCTISDDTLTSRAAFFSLPKKVQKQYISLHSHYEDMEKRYLRTFLHSFATRTAERLHDTCPDLFDKNASQWLTSHSLITFTSKDMQALFWGKNAAMNHKAGDAPAAYRCAIKSVTLSLKNPVCWYSLDALDTLHILEKSQKKYQGTLLALAFAQGAKLIRLEQKMSPKNKGILAQSVDATEMSLTTPYLSKCPEQQERSILDECRRNPACQKNVWEGIVANVFRYTK